MPDTFRYGPRPSNFSEVYPAQGPTQRGTVAMIHGGWWRSRFDLHLMDDLCTSLSEDGWRVGNVEFRRTGGERDDEGGWPQTFEDVTTALQKRAPVPDGLPTVAIGHSSGGHLALMAASVGLVDAAVGIAPITDLAWCDRESLGERGTQLFMGAAHKDAPAQYEDASPVHRLPFGRPQLIVHGSKDVRVPVEQSREYVRLARDLGDMVEYLEVEGADHFEVIDVAHPSWKSVHHWINEILPKG